tara:strand:- start:127 stop:537 length:411 start_codon:yes stop_codon:yes gene_type:complete
MKKRICNKCNIEKQITEFSPCRNDYASICKSCRNKDTRIYYKKNKEKLLNTHKEFYKSKGLDHHVVYYLPEVNYCGVTINPHYRMKLHRVRGNDTTGWKVLATAKTKKEALKIESKYHIEMGMNGARGWKLQSKNE